MPGRALHAKQNVRRLGVVVVRLAWSIVVAGCWVAAHGETGVVRSAALRAREVPVRTHRFGFLFAHQLKLTAPLVPLVINRTSDVQTSNFLCMFRRAYLGAV
jgi:hypothetical protein